MFGLRAGGVFMSRCEGVIYGRIESMYSRAPSLTPDLLRVSVFLNQCALVYISPPGNRVMLTAAVSLQDLCYEYMDFQVFFFI